jgi:simple sugar transport system ATP-binding protein
MDQDKTSDFQSNGQPIVDMKDICRSFHWLRAVDNADMDLYPGEIHALLGGNGAGKSTLMHVLCGKLKPDSGRILFEGKPLSLRNPKQAMDMGIQTIYQHLSLVETMNVYANLFLGRPIFYRAPFSWLGMVNKGAMRRRAIQEFERHGVNMPDVDAMVQRLSGGQRQSIACVRAIMGTPPKVLIMDEPTAALGLREKEGIYNIMTKCREAGTAIALISHNIEEVFKIADKITVMYLGKTIAHCKISDTSPAEVSGLITGTITPSQRA